MNVDNDYDVLIIDATRLHESELLSCTIGFHIDHRSACLFSCPSLGVVDGLRVLG